jgi:hypothetical protein
LLFSLVAMLLTVMSHSPDPVNAAEEAPKSPRPINVGGIANAAGSGTVTGIVRFKGNKFS